MVQEQGGGVEVIVGMVIDEQFGPVLMFGLGGIFVEAMKDVSFRLIPMEACDAKDMMEELKGYQVLESPRSGSVDLPAVQRLLLGISEFITRHPEIREMDLNPVFVSSHGARICDARIMVL
jgi:acyl-CoA synthetase (NDP forming)